MARRRKAQQYAEAASADARWKAMVAKMPRNMQDSAASSLPGSLRAQFGDGAAPLPPAAHCLSMHSMGCYFKGCGAIHRSMFDGRVHAGISAYMFKANDVPPSDWRCNFMRCRREGPAG
jgi:hypothetical protein